MADHVGFLISDLSRLFRRRFDERARLLGVTRPQWRTLSMLRRHEGINQGGLAELLEVEPITLCRMIDRLEEAGLVERRRDPQDRRAWRIFLTDKSKPDLDRLGAIADELLALALDGISEAERTALRGTLDRIHSNLGGNQTEFDTEQATHHG